VASWMNGQERTPGKEAVGVQVRVRLYRAFQEPGSAIRVCPFSAPLSARLHAPSVLFAHHRWPSSWEQVVIDRDVRTVSNPARMGDNECR